MRKTRPPARDVKKILWWEQNLVSNERGNKEGDEGARRHSEGRVTRASRNNGQRGQERRTAKKGR